MRFRAWRSRDALSSCTLCGKMQAMRCSSLLAPARPGRQAFTVEAKAITRKEHTQKRHARIRQKLSGTSERPRLSVFRSNEHIYAQVIDDTVGHTLAAANTLMADIKNACTAEDGKESTANKEAAKLVGKKIAELCSARNITKVSFDRGGRIYTGRVAAVAEAARENGLVF